MSPPLGTLTTCLVIGVDLVNRVILSSNPPSSFPSFFYVLQCMEKHKDEIVVPPLRLPLKENPLSQSR